MNSNKSYPKQAEPLNLRDLALHIRSLLCEIGIEPEEAASESELIIEHCTGASLAERQLLAPEEKPSPRLRSAVRKILEKRKMRVPIQYCLGYTHFMGVKLAVGPGVFIPRPDTEALVARAAELLRNQAHPVVADVGTGSGAIAVALAKALPAARIVAVDISSTALRFAAENASRAKVEDRICFLHGEWTEVLPQRFDCIVSNPPYIGMDEKQALAPEIALFEPDEALYGKGVCALDEYRKFAKLGASRLVPDGWILAETGDGKASLVMKIFQEEGWRDLSVINDVHELKRAVYAKAPRADALE